MKTQRRMKRHVPEFQPVEPKIIESANNSGNQISEEELKSLNIISKSYFKKYRKNYVYEINFSIYSNVDQIKYGSFCFLHLYSIIIPPSLFILFPRAFKGCYYLYQIQFIKNISNQSMLKYICDEAFSDTKISSIIIPDSVKEIGSLCYPSCIFKIDLENGLPELEKIGDAAFSNTQIESFNMPINIIPFVNAKNVFFKCKKLKKIIFDSFSNDYENLRDECKKYEQNESEKRKNSKINFLRDIQKMTYNNENVNNLDITQDLARSSLLSQIDIEKLEVIESNLNYFYFFNTPKLRSIVVHESNKANYIIHQGCLYTKDKKKLIVAKRNIKNSIISSKCQIISNYAFNVKCLEKVSFGKNSELKEISFLAFYDSKIKSINIPDNTDFIDYGAFYKCKHLETISISNSMYLIDYFTFAYTNISKILIPKNIIKIKFGSFLGCFNLKNVIFEEESKLIEIDDYTFAYTKINSISIPKNVKSIGNYCFYGCYELKHIVFDNSNNLENIGSNCFTNTCINEMEISQIMKTIDYSFKKKKDEMYHFIKPNLIEIITEIYIPSHVNEINFHAFCGCPKLEKVEIIDPQNSKLKIIADGAFFNCSSLHEFNIPENVNYFGYESFKNCTKYKVSINVSNNKKIFIGKSSFENSGITSFNSNCNYIKVNDFAFQNCPNIVNFSVNALNKCFIGKSVFRNCVLLKKVKINQNVLNIKIGENCFMNSSIVKFKVPQNLNEIPASCFKLCKKLKEVVINDNSKVQYIGFEAFYESKIQHIFIPCNVKKIDKSCFEKCTELIKLDISPSINNCSIDIKAFSITGITELNIPKGISQIKNGCFENCSKLKIINFSDNICMNIIDDNVFKSTKIKSLTIPSTIKKIGKSSFQNCSKLENVQFLGNDITISPSSFYECYQIKSFEFKSLIKIHDCLFSQYVYFFKQDEISLSIIKDFLVKNEQMIKFNCIYSYQHLLIDEKSSINSEIVLNHGINGHISKKFNRKLIFIKYLNGGYYSSDLKEIYYINFETESITIPKVTTLISPNAFRYSSLTKINFDFLSKLETIGKSSFEDLLIEEITIPDGVLLIDDYAFKNCKMLKNVNISKNSKLKKIGIGAFEQTAIEKIVFPLNLTIIEKFAFYKCMKLISIENHSKQIDFGYKSFYNSSIEEIEFPIFATFDISSFQGCFKLKQLSFIDTPKDLIFEVQSFASSGIESINLNCKVDILENAFSFCQKLKEVVLKGNDIKCLHNSFICPNLKKFILDLSVNIDNQNFDPKKHFLYIKDQVILSSVEKFSLNLTFQNKRDPNIYKQSFYYNHNCFVVVDELYYVNLIDNFSLYQNDGNNFISDTNDNENNNNNQEIKVDEIKKNEIITVPKNVKKLNFQRMPH